MTIVFEQSQNTRWKKIRNLEWIFPWLHEPGCGCVFQSVRRNVFKIDPIHGIVEWGFDIPNWFAFPLNDITNIKFHSFGKLGDSDSGRDVIKILTEGKGEETLNLMGRITFKKALEQVKQIIYS